MTQIEQDPLKLRGYADHLNGDAQYWNGLMKKLANMTRELGQTWDDEQYREFCSQVRQLQSELNEFSLSTQKVASKLINDAEKLEEYRRA